MLSELRICNFAVIERLHLEFSTGFHVFTGETGAGKSILVDALALLVGGRASIDHIRAEAEEAELEAGFTLPSNNTVVQRLRDSGILEPRDTELIVRRVISRTDRNRVYLNSRLTPLHVLEDLAGTLIDLHGQHDQQSLLSTARQLDALDAFGNLISLRSAYQQRFEQWKTRQRSLEEALREERERDQREDYVRFQCQELDEAALQSGEEEALLTEHKRLAHARRLRELGEEAYHLLYDSDTSILSRVSSVEDRVRQLEAVDPSVVEWRGMCEGAGAQLQEIAHQLRDYVLHLDQDPQRLAAVEDRLDQIQRLKRKYGGSLDSALSRAAELRAELDRLLNAQTRVEDLRKLVDRDEAEVTAAAGALSKARLAAAEDLEARVGKELQCLRMEKTRFRVHVRQDAASARLMSTGLDHAEYLISANEGEPLLPLAKTASGGELSRVMLALKTVLAQSDNVPILIFDEVDAGIGGAVAEVMGRRLRALGVHHQVFCITHLPQVASQADHHYVVEKGVKQKRTQTRVERLDLGGRRDEIARMLGGVTITPAVRKTAAEMVGGGSSET